MNKAVCPKCFNLRKLTKHHILPKRHFKKKEDREKIFLLCRECHDEIEKQIPFEKMQRQYYFFLLRRFILIGGGTL
ncbi:HNH endonuclease [Persephonella sp.]